MDMKDFALEVDSVVDRIVLIADEMLDAEMAGIQHAFGAMAGSSVGPLPEVVETRAPVEANVWRRCFSLKVTLLSPTRCANQSDSMRPTVRVGIAGGRVEPPVHVYRRSFLSEIGLKFQSLGKISNISTSDPQVLLGKFQHCQLLRLIFILGFP